MKGRLRRRSEPAQSIGRHRVTYGGRRDRCLVEDFHVAHVELAVQGRCVNVDDLRDRVAQEGKKVDGYAGMKVARGR